MKIFLLLSLSLFSSLSIAEGGMFYCKAENSQENFYFDVRFENKSNYLKDALIDISREGGSYDGSSVRYYDRRLSDLEWNIDSSEMTIYFDDRPTNYKRYKLISFKGQRDLIYKATRRRSEIYGFRGKLNFIQNSFWAKEKQLDVDFFCYLSDRVLSLPDLSEYK